MLNMSTILKKIKNMAVFDLEEEEKLLAQFEGELRRGQVNVDFLSFVANHENWEKEEEEEYKYVKPDLRNKILSVVEKYKRVLAPVINSFDTEGFTPLFRAVTSDYQTSGVVQKFLEVGANPFRTARQKEDPDHFANNPASIGIEFLCTPTLELVRFNPWRNYKSRYIMFVCFVQALAKGKRTDNYNYEGDCEVKLVGMLYLLLHREWVEPEEKSDEQRQRLKGVFSVRLHELYMLHHKRYTEFLARMDENDKEQYTQLLSKADGLRSATGGIRTEPTGANNPHPTDPSEWEKLNGMMDKLVADATDPEAELRLTQISASQCWDIIKTNIKKTDEGETYRPDSIRQVFERQAGALTTTCDQNCNKFEDWEERLLDGRQTEFNTNTAVEKMGNYGPIFKEKANIGYHKLVIPYPIRIEVQAAAERTGGGQPEVCGTYKKCQEVLGEGDFGVVLQYQLEKSDNPKKFALKITEVAEHEIDMGAEHCQQMKIRHIGTIANKWHMILMPVMEGHLGKLFAPAVNVNYDQRVQVVEHVRQQVVCIFQQTATPYFDLKPENILYRTQPRFCVHLGDLGSLQTKKENGREYPTAQTWQLPEENKKGSALPETIEEREKQLSYFVGLLLVEALDGHPEMSYVDFHDYLRDVPAYSQWDEKKLNVLALMIDEDIGARPCVSEVVIYEPPSVASSSIRQNSKKRTSSSSGLYESKVSSEQGANERPSDPGIKIQNSKKQKGWSVTNR